MAKQNTREVTIRFLELSETIMSVEKLSLNEYALAIKITASNLIRMRTKPDNYVSLESLCEMVKQYKASPVWLMTGKGDRFADLKTLVARSEIKTRIPGMEKSIAEMQKALKTLKKI